MFFNKKKEIKEYDLGYKFNIEVSVTMKSIDAEGNICMVVKPTYSKDARSIYLYNDDIKFLNRS